MSDNSASINSSFSIEQCLAAYEEVTAEFGFAPVIKPGRIKLLGWDLEYVCGAALANFIDQLLIRRLNDFIPDNDQPLILDCGANIGFSVLSYKRRFPDARIIAFEPDPQFSPILRRNLDRNNAADVEVIESAVWIKNGEEKWFSEGIDGSKILESAENGVNTVVRTIDLADYLEQDIDLLKIDIEGAEYEVISHVGTRLQTVKNIVVECHIDQSKIEPFAEMLALLKESGFKVGINSFGPWRDLIRQTEILPNHWGQYLSVAGWRSEIQNAGKNYTLLPYVGRELPLMEARLEQTRSELQQTQFVLQQTQFEVLRIPAYLQRLFASKYTKKIKFSRKEFISDSGYCWKISIPKYFSVADNELAQTSPLQLFENNKELGPAHALHNDIRTHGGGLYSHWKDNIYFSTSDNTDPHINGRKYRAMIDMGGDRCIKNARTLLPKVIGQFMEGINVHNTKSIEDIIAHDNPNFRALSFKKGTRLKVVHYIGQLGPGGAERQLCNSAIRMHEMGFDVTVLVQYSLEGECGHYLQMLTSRGIPVRIPSPCRISTIQKEILHNSYIDISPLKSLSGDIFPYVYDLANELIEIKPDVLHCWLDYCNIVGGIGGLITGVPRILIGGRNVNPTYFPLMYRPWFETWYKVLAKSKRLLFVNNSKAGAEDYAHWLGLPSDRISIIYNGLDFNQFETFCWEDVIAFRQSLGIDEKAPLVGGIFRLGPEKRPMDFLAAVKRIKENLGDVKAVIAGVGVLEREIKQHIRREHLDDTVIMLGQCTDVYCMMKACNLILHTAEVEGTPNVLLEAQYLGVPVVATKAGGTAEVVLDGITGLLHPIGDIDGLSESAIRILSDKAYGQNLGREGSIFMREKFSMENMINSYLNIYNYKSKGFLSKYWRGMMLNALTKVIRHYQKYGLFLTAKAILVYSANFFVSRHLSLRLLGDKVRRFPSAILHLPRHVEQKGYNLLIRYHRMLLDLTCRNSFLLRKVCKPRAVRAYSEVRVLHVTCSFDLGGTQRQIMNLCEGSNNRGISHCPIEVFPEMNYLYRREEKLDKARYVRGNLLTRKLGSIAMSPDYRSLQILQIYKLVQDFRAMNPDVVVGWGHEIAMLTFVAASIARVPKIVFCIRTFDPSHGWTSIGDVLKKAHKKMTPFLSGIIVNSSVLQNNYSKWLNIPEKMVRVCPNGIGNDTLSAEERLQCRRTLRENYGISDDALVVLNIGRFSKEKGQMVLVKAYHRLINMQPARRIYCILCGDGPTQGDVRKYVNDNDLRYLLMPGRIDNVHSYLSASDIFVMPSDFEGMPNAMMEAMAYGLPCISTNRSGVLDVARDNHEALYIDVGSVEQLTERLVYFSERDDERRRLGNNARRRLDDFSVPAMITMFNRHLKEIIQ